MARLTLVASANVNKLVAPHRASATEGEAAIRLLEQQGYPIKRVAQGQAHLRCFAGETRYITRNGVRTLRETVGTSQMVLDSSAQWVPAEIREFGVQRLLALKVCRNKITKTIYTTAGHRWFRVAKGESKRRRSSREVVTTDLRPGDRLAEAFPMTRVRTGWGPLRVSPVGIMHGFVVGDGSRQSAGSVAYLYRDNKIGAVLPYYGLQHQAKDEDRGCVVVHDLPGYFKDWWPPTTEGRSYLYGWLAGLFAADGHVSAQGQVTFYSSRLDLIEHVRDVCQELGIQVYSIVRKDRTDVRLPQGGTIDATLYSLCFNGETLTEEFFLQDKHRERWVRARERQTRSAPTGWAVVSVEETDRVETVYCAVVPSSGSFTLEDNILTGNCPFHEGPGQVETRKSANFYLNTDSGLFFCQSASCGERGNLRLLEKFFGIDSDDGYTASFQSREDQLRLFEALLTTPLRKPFYDHGLTDQTIERFRLGYQPQHTETIDDREVTISARYVIPYLEGRRPKLFRYYQPYGDPKWKYTWEAGAEASLFNPQDAVGDTDGIVVVAEGEIKCALLVQLGYAAVGVPGAGQWRDEWQAGFTHARQIIFVYDNDNPFFHNYDKPEEGRVCRKCAGHGLDRCAGHNPGQDAAVVRVEQLGWRAKNVLLPLPNDRARKTDINDYFVRDGHTNAEFAELALNKRPNEYKVASLADITASPPEEAVFLVDQGILPRAGRLLIAGKPKAGKSLLVNNLALSLAAGIPFLGRFPVDHPTRVLLLDRELSKWSLFKRLHELIDYRPGYRAAMDNLLVDHDHLIRLDQKNAFEVLQALVEQNGAEVVVLDTAYKFLAGDVESSSALMKAFEVLDKLIHTTDVAVVMTHHLRKGMGARGKENTDIADPDAVAGSFLWTGWPNATVLLNFLDRSVENPFNAVATFTAFRDSAAPDPLALYRGRESIAYTAITDYSHSDEPSRGSRPVAIRPTTEAVANLLLELCPTPEEDFLYIAAARFGISPQVVKPYYLDALGSGAFVKSRTKPHIVSFVDQEVTESWESEHGLPERPLDDMLFDAAALNGAP